MKCRQPDRPRLRVKLRKRADNADLAGDSFDDRRVAKQHGFARRNRWRRSSGHRLNRVQGPPPTQGRLPSLQLLQAQDMVRGLERPFEGSKINKKPGNSESQGGGGLKLFPGAIGAVVASSGRRRGSGSASFHAGGPARIAWPHKRPHNRHVSYCSSGRTGRRLSGGKIWIRSGSVNRCLSARRRIHFRGRQAIDLVILRMPARSRIIDLAGGYGAMQRRENIR